MELKKAYYEQEIEKTKKELNDLQNNPAAIEKYARERYLMKKEGEDIFIVEVKYSPGDNWKNFTLFTGNSNIRTKNLTSINANKLNNKIIQKIWIIRCRNSSICSENGNSNVKVGVFLKLKSKFDIIFLYVCSKIC